MYPISSCAFLVLLALPLHAAVEVDGRLLVVNDHDRIPRGLLGVHADKGLTEEEAREWGIDGYRQIHFVPGSGTVFTGKKERGMEEAPVKEWMKELAVVVDCQGDRFYPAVCLKNPDYEDHFAKIGKAYAERCERLGIPGYAEFWNEPYLNWAERSRKNYDVKFYDASKAVDGGKVTIKGWDEPLEHLRWRRLWARDTDGGKINHLVPVPEDAEPGDTFTHESRLYFMPKGERTYEVVEKWGVHDPTAPSFWSGRQNYDFYIWMFLPWAKAIKETNPGVTVIGGWDFHIKADGWKAWELLYKPLIDDGIEYLDGISEHHYGSNTRGVAATYEVVVGYAMAEHGKWLHCYNTETAGCEDPAVPGNRHGQATPYGAFNYGLRDITELMYRSPDKAVLRTSHGRNSKGWGLGGDEFLFKLLEELRGRLVHTATDDLDVWPVAAWDEEARRLVVVVFNDHREARTIPIEVAAPAGTAFSSGMLTRVVPTQPKGPLEFFEEELALADGGFAGEITIPQRTGVKLSFAVDGDPAPVTVERTQSFAKGVLVAIEPGVDEPARPFKIALDPERLAGAERAWIKCAFEGLDTEDEAKVVINGVDVDLPVHDWLTEVPIDPGILDEKNRCYFATFGDGYKVDVCSIVIEGPAE